MGARAYKSAKLWHLPRCRPEKMSGSLSGDETQKLLLLPKSRFSLHFWPAGWTLVQSMSFWLSSQLAHLAKFPPFPALHPQVFLPCCSEVGRHVLKKPFGRLGGYRAGLLWIQRDTTNSTAGVGMVLAFAIGTFCLC